MNIESLKQEFYSYLESKGKLKGKDVTSADDLNIFDFSNEFRKFLKTQDDIEFSGKGFKIDDFIEILDNSDSDDILDTLENAKADMDKDGENVLDFLTYMLQDEDFSSTMDADGDDKIDKSELVTFLNSISKNDNNKSNITLRDLIKGGKKVKQGNFEMPEVESWDDILKSNGVKSKDDASTSAVSGGGGGGYSSSSSSSSSSTTETPKTTADMIALAQTSYADYSLEQLQAEQTEQEEELTTQNNAFQAALNGSSKTLTKLKSDMDENYDKFLELCEGEEELVKNTKAKKAELDAKELEINQNTADQVDTEYQKVGVETQITQVKECIQQCTDSVTALEGQLSNIPDNTTDANGNTVDNSAQKQALQNQITALNTQKAQLNDQKEELEQQKTDLETKIAELETQAETLSAEHKTLQEELETLESNLIGPEQGEKAQAYNDYNNSKMAYDEAKDNEMLTAIQNKYTVGIQIEAIKTQMVVAQWNAFVEEFSETYYPDESEEDNKDDDEEETS